MVLTKIMTSKEKTNAFAVIQGILSESGPAGFYTGIQVRAIRSSRRARCIDIFDLPVCFIYQSTKAFFGVQ